MSLQGIINVMAAIVTLGVITVIVTSPQSSSVIGAFGDAFSGSLRAAMGR